MSSNVLFGIFGNLPFLTGPILALFMVAAGVLLAKAEPRPHVFAFLTGAVIVALLGIAHFLIFSPWIGLMHRRDWGAWDHQRFAMINGGISFVGHGLMAFGLFSFAVVHLRRSRQEKCLE